MKRTCTGPLFSALVVMSARLFVAGVAGAEEEPKESKPHPSTPFGTRPVEVISVEANPLAWFVHRYGGQVQLAVYGPFTFVAGATHLGLTDTVSTKMKHALIDVAKMPVASSA